MDRKKTLALPFIVAVHAGTNVVVVVDRLLSGPDHTSACVCCYLCLTSAWKGLAFQ